MHSSVQLLANTTSSSTDAVVETTTTAVNGAVENVGGMAELLQNYGAGIVLLAVFIIVFLFFSFFILKTMNNMMSQIKSMTTSEDNLNKEVVTKIIDSYIKQKETEEEKAEIEKESNLVSGFSYANMSMNDASRIVMSETHCDRVGVYVFHNGNQTPFGFPFVKTTCINEFTMKGSPSTIRGLSHNGLPLHVLTNFVENLIDNGECIIDNVINYGIVHSDNEIMNFISGANVKALFALAIKADNGELAAFTIAEFRNEQDFSNSETYNTVKNALDIMNKSIRSIVLNENFKNDAIKHHNRGSH